MVTVARAQSDLDAAKVVAAEAAARLKEASDKKDAIVAQYGISSPEASAARREFNQANGANLEAQQAVIAEEQVFNSAQKNAETNNADPATANPPAPQNSVSVAEIDTAPAPIDAYNPSVQTFDDGSTFQTFDDGSTLATDSTNNVTSSPATSDSSPLASEIQRGINNARAQPVRAVQLGQEAGSGDWRVKLRLAQGATYLYNAEQPGILEPLRVTNGVIFPYTPKIDISYKANYSTYDLTHSNFRGYYYQNSQVGDIGITGHFTAQDTTQANYLLAVIHFFRSATKMFYGQDAQRGSPPPLVFLSGLGQYQFSNHPCLIADFSYSLPEDVDYIRAQVTNQVGLNLTVQNNVKQSVATNNIFSSIQRLANAFTTKGAVPNTPFGSPNVPNLAQGSPTYVPTKMDITIKLLPVNTRQQVSQQFSLREFANGNQLKGGFW